MTLLPSATAQATLLGDNFEDDDVFQAPTGDWYTHVTSGTISSFVQANDTAPSQPNAWRVAGDTFNSGVGLQLDAALDLCGETVSFWFLIDAIPTAVPLRDGPTIAAGESVSGPFDTTSSGGLGLIIDNAGVVKIAAEATGAGTALTQDLGTISANVWYDITFSELNCGATRITAYSNALGASVTVDQTGSITGPLDVFKVHSVASNNPDVYIDNIETSMVAPPPTVTPSTTRTLGAGLQGFDVDPTGTTAILRIDNNVTTIAAKSLSGTATNNTGCGVRADGIVALESMVAFYGCNPSTLQTETLHIRTSTLGSPTSIWPDQCNSFCSEDIATADLAGDQEAEFGRELGQIAAYPFDYSTYENRGVLTDRVRMAWAASGFNAGTIGSFTYQMNEGADPDKSRSDTVLLDPSGSPQIDQICTMSYNDQHFLLGGTQNADTKGYRLDFTSEDLGSALGVSLTHVFTAPTSGSQAAGLDCADGTVAVWGNIAGPSSAGGISVSDFATGTTLWTKDATIGGRGAAISEIVAGEQYVAWRNGNEVLVGYASNGTELASLTWDSTYNFFGVYMDQAAQNVWVLSSNATETLIERFLVYPYTTGSEVAFFDPDAPVVGANETAADAVVDLSQGGFTVAEPGDALFGSLIVEAATDIGVGANVIAWLFGLIFTVAMTVGFFFIGGGNGSPAMGGIGALLGAGAGVGFGWIPLWVPIVAVAISLGVVFWRRSG